jgi:hypothetical protein
LNKFLHFRETSLEKASKQKSTGGAVPQPFRFMTELLFEFIVGRVGKSKDRGRKARRFSSGQARITREISGTRLAGAGLREYGHIQANPD